MDISDQPTVSIIIPAWNAEPYLRCCLEKLKFLKYPKDRLEIVVVDNGSGDRTVEISREYGVRVLSFPDGLVGAVRNYGVKNSSGEIVAFLDADCEVFPGWIMTAVEHLKQKEVGAVGGCYTVQEDATWIEKLFVSESKSYPFEVSALPGGSFIARRQVFESVGGFNEALSAGEDDDLSYRIDREGYKIILDPMCTVVHLGYPKTLWKIFTKQRWHSSNQMEARKTRVEPIVILTHVFLIALLSMSVGIILWVGGYRPVLIWGAAFTLTVIPTITTIVKRNRNKTVKNRVLRFSQLFLFFFFFYLGRARGLVDNYSSKFSSWSARKKS